jgi:hypothetical protein
MKRKLLMLAVLLGVSTIPAWAPQAEAAVYCGPVFCANRPLTTSCACPPGTDRVGSPSSCGTYQSIGFNGCWYE